MRILAAAGAALSFFLAMPAIAVESTLDRIKQSGVIKLGYRENSPPFSFFAEDKKPRGYSIELCQRVASGIATQLNLQLLEVKWVPVDGQSRFEALKSGEIDLHCGNTTQTLSRRAEFDFSLMTFVDGAGVMYRAGEKPATVDDMKGQRFAVVVGSTTEQILDRMIAGSKLGARLLRLKDHDAALAALKDKTATAYAADRTVLITTALKSGGGAAFDVSNVQFSYEPYGLMMRRDADLRLSVDRVLARLYRNGEIELILGRWFAPIGNLTEAMNAMIQLNALPE